MAFSQVGSFGCPTAAWRYRIDSSIIGSLYRLLMTSMADESEIDAYPIKALMRSRVAMIVFTMYALLRDSSFVGWLLDRLG